MNDALLKPGTRCYFTCDIIEPASDCSPGGVWRIKGHVGIVSETYDPMYLGFRYKVEHELWKIQFYVHFNEVSVVNPNSKGNNNERMSGRVQGRQSGGDLCELREVAKRLHGQERHVAVD